MKIRFYILLFFIINSAKCVGQGIDKVWALGYGCCSGQFAGINFDFTSGSLLIDTVQRYMNFVETNGQICDSTGKLLFYSNGIYVANSNDDTMQNGSGLNPCQFTTNHSTYGLTLTQGNFVIPFPADNNKYYLFHLSDDDYAHSYGSLYLYYSIIDMQLDNGLGAVLQKNTILLNDTITPGGLTACKHANGRDWWIFSHDYFTGLINKFLITPIGISGPFTQDLIRVRSLYQGVFSNDGNYFASYEPRSDLDIWSFDRCTGDFFDPVHIDINDSALLGGVAFSPSGRFLYVSSMNYIYQFDMLAPDIPLSQLTVGVYDGFISWASANFFLAALAPDGKIYINCGNSTLDMHVINYPDSFGLSCDFCQHCIHLPAFNAFTIPNHPNYYLGPVSGSQCDSLVGIENVISSINKNDIFPNPTNDKLFVTQDKKNLISNIEVFNSLGQIQSIAFSSISNDQYVEINTSELTSGIYFLKIILKEKEVVRRFVKN